MTSALEPVTALMLLIRASKSADLVIAPPIAFLMKLNPAYAAEIPRAVLIRLLVADAA